ncbi:hypothetical protein [Dechloromonas sp. A34]|uniref:hypothetical protein n=1 Tax=Dechloromonas sp. A34 TaxID=447588 RepID=UPI0022491E2D|nr:hypothetical protein [Dechloromonas sp. A34]
MVENLDGQDGPTANGAKHGAYSDIVSKKLVPSAPGRTLRPVALKKPPTRPILEVHQETTIQPMKTLWCRYWIAGFMV